MRSHSSRRLVRLGVATLLLTSLTGGLGSAAWAAGPEPAPVGEAAGSAGVVLAATITPAGDDVVFTATNNTSSTFVDCNVLVKQSGESSWWGQLISFTAATEFAPGQSWSWRGDVIAPDQITVSLECIKRKDPLEDQAMRTYSNFVTTANPKGYARSSMTQQLYRFYKSDGTHFYTASDHEASLVRTYPQYKEELSIGLIAPANATNTIGLTPIYRFYKSAQGVHFYTTSEDEAKLVKTYPEYSFEGVVGYAPTLTEYYHQGRPSIHTVGRPLLANVVYRFYKWTQGTHFYTGSLHEAGYVGSEYRYESTPFYTAFS